MQRVEVQLEAPEGSAKNALQSPKANKSLGGRSVCEVSSHAQNPDHLLQSYRKH
jgi:hypothetical protein